MPAQVPLPDGLIDAFNNPTGHGDQDDLVTLLYRPGDRMAVLLVSYCDTCAPQPTIARLGPDGKWSVAGSRSDAAVTDTETRAMRDTMSKGDPAAIEIREIRRRQLFINGKPVGDDFE